MRFGGFLMIWGGCLGTGIWCCCRYLRGIRTMMHLEVLLLLMEERMRYGRNSMTTVLQELSNKSGRNEKILAVYDRTGLFRGRVFCSEMAQAGVSVYESGLSERRGTGRICRTWQLSGKPEPKSAAAVTGAVPQQTACIPFRTAEIKTKVY